MRFRSLVIYLLNRLDVIYKLKKICRGNLRKKHSRSCKKTASVSEDAGFSARGPKLISIPTVTGEITKSTVV